MKTDFAGAGYINNNRTGKVGYVLDENEEKGHCHYRKEYYGLSDAVGIGIPERNAMAGGKGMYTGGICGRSKNCR